MTTKGAVAVRSVAERKAEEDARRKARRSILAMAGSQLSHIPPDADEPMDPLEEGDLSMANRTVAEITQCLAFTCHLHSSACDGCKHNPDNQVLYPDSGSPGIEANLSYVPLTRYSRKGES